MEEALKEKLERLITEEKEKCEKGQDSKEPEFLLGYMLWQERVKRNFVMEDVVKGICSKTTLERFERVEELEQMLENVESKKNEKEKTEEDPDYLLLHFLLNRMGMSAEKFEFYYDQKEKEDKEIRDWFMILEEKEKLKRGFEDYVRNKDTLEIDIDKNEQKKNITNKLYKELYLIGLNNYEQALIMYKKKKHTMWDKIWIYWQQLIYQLVCDHYSGEIEEKWNDLCAQNLFYTDEEWKFLYTLAAYYRHRNNYKEANKVYLQMYLNAIGEKNMTKNKMTGKKIKLLSKLKKFTYGEENKKDNIISNLSENCVGRNEFVMDEERQLEILPKFCLTYGKFLWEYEKLQRKEDKDVYWKPEEIFLYGIQLNVKFGRNYFLYELMENYCKLLFEKWNDFTNLNLISEKESKIIEKSKRKYLKELIKYEQYLLAWEVARKNFVKAKKRLKFMKEELKWENIILVHTCNVLAKQPD